MSRLEEQQKRLENRQAFNKAIPSSEFAPKLVGDDDSFQEYLRKLENQDRVYRRDVASKTVSTTPTYFEMRNRTMKMRAGEEVEPLQLTKQVENRFDPNTIGDFPSMPSRRETPFLSEQNSAKIDKRIAEKGFEIPQEEKDKAFKEGLKSFFVGNPDRESVSRIIDPENPPAVTGGALGFLYGTTLRGEDQERAERYEKLLRKGVEPEKAYSIAEAWGTDMVLPPGTTDEERKYMRNFSIAKGAFIALELSDLLFVGKPINVSLKGLSRSGRLALYTDIAMASDMAMARSILKTRFPELAGTAAGDELIAIARQANKYDSWSKIIRENKEVQRIFGEAGTSARITADTQAQRVMFENGIPVVRGAESAPIKDSLRLRETIRTFLRSKEAADANRLSTDAIWNSEVKAGTVTFDQNKLGSLNVFIPDTGAGLNTLRPGARVALTREALEKGLEAGKTKMLSNISADDLVRLPDGTFVYAPREVVGKNLEPTLQGIRQEKATKIAQAEKQIKESRAKEAQQHRMNKEAEARRAEEVADKARIKAAREREIFETRRAQAIAQAEKVIESSGELKRTERNRIATKAKEDVAPLKKAQDELLSRSKALAKERAKNLVRFTKSKDKQAIRDKFQARMDRVQAAKTLSASEKADRMVSLRNAMEAELKAVDDARNALLKERDRIDSELEQIAKELKTAKYGEKADEILANSRKEWKATEAKIASDVKEARSVLKNAKDEGWAPAKGADDVITKTTDKSPVKATEKETPTVTNQDPKVPAIYREGSEFYADTERVSQVEYVRERLTGIGNQRKGNKKMLEIFYSEQKRVQKKGAQPEPAPMSAKVAKDEQLTPIQQAEKKLKESEEVLYWTETSRDLLRESIQNDPARQLMKYSGDGSTSLAQIAENRSKRELARKVNGGLLKEERPRKLKTLKKDKDGNVIQQGGDKKEVSQWNVIDVAQRAEGLGYKSLDEADEAVQAYRKSKENLKEMDAQVKLARDEFKAAKKAVDDALEEEYRLAEDAYGDEIAQHINASLRYDEAENVTERIADTVGEVQGAYKGSPMRPVVSTTGKKAMSATNKKTVQRIEERLAIESEDDLLQLERTGTADEVKKARERIASTNKEQAIEAVKLVDESPAEMYDNILNSNYDPPNSTRAAVTLALMDSSFVTGDISKRMRLAAQSYYDGTRIAQELQSRIMMRDRSFTSMMDSLYRAQAQGLKKVGGKATVDAQVKALNEALGEAFDNFTFMTKDDALKAVDDIMCK